jgi:hypothetical protein
MKALYDARILSTGSKNNAAGLNIFVFKYRDKPLRFPL